MKSYDRIVDDEELAENIAIGVHTGLRKGTDAPSSGPLWRAINDSNDGAWEAAVAYCVDGLRSMGFKFVRTVEGEPPVG